MPAIGPTAVPGCHREGERVLAHDLRRPTGGRNQLEVHDLSKQIVEEGLQIPTSG